MLRDILVCGNCGGIMGGKVVKDSNVNSYFCLQKTRQGRNKKLKELGL